MTEQSFTASRLWQAADISPDTYHQWRARKFLPSKAEGSGKPQLYSPAEVFRVAVLARLVTLGISIKMADLGFSVAAAETTYKSTGGKPYFLMYDPAEDQPGSQWSPLRAAGRTVGEAELAKEVGKYEAVAVVSLDKIKARVKRVLGIDS